MDASNAPVRRSRTELHTDDIAIDQMPAIESVDDLLEEIVVAPEVLEKEYAEALKMAEEPVTIRVERSSEKFAPKMIDCWVNGKGAEIVINGKWVETRVIPVGIPVTVKRKYIEVLARSKIDSVTTNVRDPDTEHPRNEVERYTSSKAPFSVLQDCNPKGAAWLNNLIRTNA